MGVVRTFTYTLSELEKELDKAKAVTIKGLVASDLLDLESADEWSASHTIILREKGCFVRLLDKITGKEPPKDTLRFVVVKELHYD